MCMASSSHDLVSMHPASDVPAPLPYPTPCSQMFQLLGLKTTGPNAVTKETVTLTHFLDMADSVVGQGG